mmetsp:Transcript_31840/g.52487  ORF Transcript_31840/g.52487 Transcript_31840/m.52487 type:complete len:324 (+) Transcript_31840:23-994(+)
MYKGRGSPAHSLREDFHPYSSMEEVNGNDNTSIASTAERQGSTPLRRLGSRRRQRENLVSPSKRRLLIEDHYRVDATRRVVLPGVPKHEAHGARDAHDFFNLVVLIPLLVLNIMNWNWDILGGMPENKKSLENAWTGEWFYVFYLYCQFYFVADLIWIVLIPNCVRSPTTIMQHHVFTIFYMLVPLFFPKLRFVMVGAFRSVDFNTWFLISRRVFNKQGFPPWIIGLPMIISIRVKIISILFYATWIVTRCIIYPILLVDLIERWQVRTALLKTPFNVGAIIVPLHSCFVVLNFKWSYDLLWSKIRYWRRRRRRRVRRTSEMQ